ncbi:MAG TPA: AAA family ATPase [Streptosporangiaceae bacterium]|nr:AAA family ATPase [Streptosporangiaceae bacterium]
MHAIDSTGAYTLGDASFERRLCGRRGEREALDRLLSTVRAGQSRTLVLRGEAGIGKTALLGYLLERASGCRIARAAGAPSETELAFAGLHQLCAPFQDRIEHLPDPQRAALDTALGLRDGDAPDRFAVGLAVLNLLADAARERPLVCVVDDAQWLDRASAQALAFVARRLVTEPVAVVFAVRQSGTEQDLAGLAELLVSGLPDGDARALLDSVITGPLDERVRDRIVAETRGNPLALLELARAVTPEELAGGIGLPCVTAMPGRIEDGFRRQLALLPPPTRRLLLVAAAEPAGDPLLLWRAADRLGVPATAAAPAVAAGLIEFGGHVRFCHPLARSAAYRAAAPPERHSAHRALAEATDPGIDPDRRAWHRALAATGLNEDVAAELERSASRARARGGLAAAAAFCERAAELTPDRARRARRALAAAQAKQQAGAPDAALRLLAMAGTGPLGELGHAHAELLHAQLAVDLGRNGDAPQLLLKAASRLEPLHAGLAREAYRDAFQSVLAAGRLAIRGGLLEVAEAVRAAPQALQPPGACDRLLDGLAVLITEGKAVGTPMLRRALKAFRDRAPADEGFRWLPLACSMSRDIWDDESWYTLSARLIEYARQAGALTALPAALLMGVPIRLLAGELAMAVSMTEEAETVGRVTANPAGPYGRMLLAAWTGREAEAVQVTAAATSEMTARGEGQWLTAAAWVTAVLSNGLGRYDKALAAAEQASSEYPDELGLAAMAMAELIEAAVRTGQPERATGAMRHLSETTTTADTDWALGIQARSRALLSDGEPAECLYREAIDRLGRTRVRVELARAHLVYGEWLRRQNRRVDARDQLRTAYEMLTAMEIHGFAERARRELLATGETVRKRTVEAARQLTGQEAQIARLAGEGNTNPEIGARLFLSPRTVEYHLHKIFRKLGIGSRRELRRALPHLEQAALAA